MKAERFMTINASDVDWNGIPSFPAGDWERAVSKTRSCSRHTQVAIGPMISVDCRRILNISVRHWGAVPCITQTLTRVTCTLYVSPLVANVVSSVVTHAISFSLFLQLCEFCTEQHNRVNGSTKTPTVRQRTRHLAGHLAPHWRSSIFPAHIAHRSVPPTNYFCCCNDGVGGFSFGLYILARLVSA